MVVLAAAGCIARGSFDTGAVATPTPLSPLVQPGSVDGPVFILDNFEREGAGNGEDWSTFADKGGLGTTSALRRVPGGAKTRGRALQFSGYLGSAKAPYAWSVMTLNWSAGRKPTDVTAIKGIRFWVKGDGNRYKLLITKAASRDHADFQYVFDAPREWTAIEVPIDLMAQPTWGEWMERRFDDALSIDFQPQTTDSQYNVFIDDVELILDPKRKFPYKAVDFIEELPLDELVAKRASYTPISVEAAANRSYEDEVAGDGKGGWTDQGENSVPGMPTGKQVFGGIPFVIPSKPGKQVIVLRGQNDKHLPTSATIPMNGARGRALYFLHAGAWGAVDNGHYTVEYADGTRADIPLSDKLQVFDFWNPDESPVARPAWIGKNKSRDRIGLTLFAWQNAKPDVPIKSVIAATKGDGAYLMVGGVTVASDGPYLAKSATIEFKGPRFFPYEGVHVAERRGTALDLSGTLDAPTGKHGVLGRKGEDFVFADGTKGRFWGMDVADQANFPTKAQADWMAEFLAQLGVNMTRHHLMDAHWSDHNIFGLKPDTTQQLDPEWLDRFDYLVAQLQKRGVYQYLDLIIQRKPLAKDGVHEPENVEPGYKMVGEFDEQLIVNQEKIAKLLLAHKNPYTGKTYAEDPSVVMIDITNESTLFFLGDWGQGELRSKYHRALLQKLWNERLARQGDRASLAKRWAVGATDKRQGLAADEDPAKGTVRAIYDLSERSREHLKYSPARVRDYMTFLADEERAYYKRMTGVIRAVGFKGLVTGTNHWIDQPMDEYVNATTDYIDRHAYWGHPFTMVYQYKAGYTPIQAGAAIQDAQKALVPILAAKRVKGLPYIITEWNNCHPLYRSEALLMMAGYSSLHGWSALQYSFSGQPLSESDQKDARLDSVFDMWFQATNLALWPATSLLYHRGDVREADASAWRPMDDAEAHDPDTRVGLPDGLAFVAKSGMEFTKDAKHEPTWDKLLAKHVDKRVARSVTGELVTDWGTGLFRLDTARSQGAAGFLGGHPQRLANADVAIDNAYGTVVVTSLDKAPLAKARRILVTAVGNTVNSGMEVRPGNSVLKAGGQSPILIEALAGSVKLHGLEGDASGLKAYRLTVSGARAGEVPIERDGEGVTVKLRPEYRAMHYELVR